MDRVAANAILRELFFSRDQTRRVISARKEGGDRGGRRSEGLVAAHANSGGQQKRCRARERAQDDVK